jgi:hypothetical protein
MLSDCQSDWTFLKQLKLNDLMLLIPELPIITICMPQKNGYILVDRELTNNYQMTYCTKQFHSFYTAIFVAY